MRAVDVLRQVRDGGAGCSPADLQAFVQGVTDGTVTDYQASAFCMAVYCRGLPDELTAALTLAMRDSGTVLDLATLPGVKVDKHSTGGVGDKISLPLAPLVAACGVTVPMVSGRGLGHTGGTLDKLEAIPGFRTDIGVTRFVENLRHLGVAMMGQTAQLAPADRKLYALRDVTATVESIPLITASILAKKLAEGVDALVLDVKVGRGAFMRTLGDAQRLAESLVRVGRSAGLRVRALLTRMEAPLGRSIGNALEVREALDILHNRGPADTTELTVALAAEMLVLGGVASDVQAGLIKARAALSSGAAKTRFRQLVAAQGGDPNAVDDPGLLPQARFQTPVCAPRAGVVTALDSFALGQVAMRLGAGRLRAEDSIDPAVGLVLTRQVGDEVASGEPVLVVHHNGPAREALDEIGCAVQIGPAAPAALPAVLERF